MGRVIGMDIHRTFAEVVVWEDGRLRPTGRVDMTRSGLEGFGRTLAKTDEVVVEATGNAMAVVRVLGPYVARVIVANPLPTDEQLDPQLHDATLAEGMSLLERDHITGKAVTPFLLAHFPETTEGQSLAVNVRIILRNAALAARIAVAATTGRAAIGFALPG